MAPLGLAPQETKLRIAVARGDGIGPEITDATLAVLDAASVDLELDPVELGAAVYARGVSSGVERETLERIRTARALLKGPITTPSGGGVKSLNVTLRKSLSLFANVRPCLSYSPYVAGHPGLDVLVVRENEEDTYGGIEHRQTEQVTQCLKLITRPGSERLIRFAFGLARAYGRRRVTCMTKSNIMKITDGLFMDTFRQVAEEFPELASDHQIIDIGTARLATRPEDYDVVVLPNLYGDIVSDVTAELSGSVGLCGSANVGATCAMFEAIHGSAPDIAGQGIANPSGLLLAAVQMLVHLGLPQDAQRIHNAWLSTIEAGIHTADIKSETTRQRVGTQAFAAAVIARLGEEPRRLPCARYELGSALAELARDSTPAPPRPQVKELVGVDVFLDWSAGSPAELGDRLRRCGDATLPLEMITNRGVRVWPQGLPETFCTDHWRCRFRPEGGSASWADVLALLGRLSDAGFEVIKLENLYTFDGRPGFSLGQGQ